MAAAAGQVVRVINVKVADFRGISCPSKKDPAARNNTPSYTGRQGDVNSMVPVPSLAILHFAQDPGMTVVYHPDREIELTGEWGSERDITEGEIWRVEQDPMPDIDRASDRKPDTFDILQGMTRDFPDQISQKADQDSRVSFTRWGFPANLPPDRAVTIDNCCPAVGGAEINCNHWPHATAV
jgi:hypothetical protein